MKKIMAFSMSCAMLLTMGTAAFADVNSGIVGEEKNEWPNEFNFGGEIKLIRGEQAESFGIEQAGELELQPGDDLYIPLYFTTQEGESVVIGASKEEMTGSVPYTGEINKNWKLNFVNKAKDMVETAELYKATSADKNLIKGAVYLKAQTVDSYNSLDDLEFEMSAFISERYSKNKTEQIELEGIFANPKSETQVSFEWENNVFDKAVWEVNEDEDGTATFNFNDDAYFTVRMFGGDKVMFDFDKTYNKEVAGRYSEDLHFYNFKGDLDSFSTTGTLTIPTEQEMYMYEIVDGAVRETNAVYNEDTDTVELRTRNLGEYVLSPEKLDLSDEKPAEDNVNDSKEEDDVVDEIVEETPVEGENNESNDYLGGGKGNPDTGADDMVSMMAGLAAVSAVGGVLTFKKKK